MFHDYIMENYKKFGFPINNIYSSLIDNILDDGINFWNSRVRKGKAEFVYGFQRYRMILPK
jgi:hypothetical protein